MCGNDFETRIERWLNLWSSLFVEPIQAEIEGEVATTEAQSHKMTAGPGDLVDAVQARRSFDSRRHANVMSAGSVLSRELNYRVDASKIVRALNFWYDDPRQILVNHHRESVDCVW